MVSRKEKGQENEINKTSIHCLAVCWHTRVWFVSNLASNASPYFICIQKKGWHVASYCKHTEKSEAQLQDKCRDFSLLNNSSSVKLSLHQIQLAVHMCILSSCVYSWSSNNNTQTWVSSSCLLLQIYVRQVSAITRLYDKFLQSFYSMLSSHSCTAQGNIFKTINADNNFGDPVAARINITNHTAIKVRSDCGTEAGGCF